jgi:hypothetical protein
MPPEIVFWADWVGTAALTAKKNKYEETPK